MAPEKRPLERVFGPQLGTSSARCMKSMVSNSISRTASGAIDGKRVTLKSGGALDADLVVIGVGVRPRLALAEQAGLAIDKGVIVNKYWKPARPAFTPPAISPAGRIRSPASASASSIGWSPNGRGKSLRST